MEGKGRGPWVWFGLAMFYIGFAVVARQQEDTRQANLFMTGAVLLLVIAFIVGAHGWWWPKLRPMLVWVGHRLVGVRGDFMEASTRYACEDVRDGRAPMPLNYLPKIGNLIARRVYRKRYLAVYEAAMVERHDWMRNRTLERLTWRVAVVTKGTDRHPYVTHTAVYHKGVIETVTRRGETLIVNQRLPQLGVPRPVKHLTPEQIEYLDRATGYRLQP